MATIKQDVTLKHQSNLSQEVEDVNLAAGETVTVLKEWKDRVLCKNADGKHLTVPKELVEL